MFGLSSSSPPKRNKIWNHKTQENETQNGYDYSDVYGYVFNHVIQYQNWCKLMGIETDTLGQILTHNQTWHLYHDAGMFELLFSGNCWNHHGNEGWGWLFSQNNAPIIETN